MEKYIIGEDGYAKLNPDYTEVMVAWRTGYTGWYSWQTMPATTTQAHYTNSGESDSNWNEVHETVARRLRARSTGFAMTYGTPGHSKYAGFPTPVAKKKQPPKANFEDYKPYKRKNIKLK